MSHKGEQRYSYGKRGWLLGLENVRGGYPEMPDIASHSPDPVVHIVRTVQDVGHIAQDATCVDYVVTDSAARHQIYVGNASKCGLPRHTHSILWEAPFCLGMSVGHADCMVCLWLPLLSPAR